MSTFAPVTRILSRCLQKIQQESNRRHGGLKAAISSNDDNPNLTEVLQHFCKTFLSIRSQLNAIKMLTYSKH